MTFKTFGKLSTSCPFYTILIKLSRENNLINYFPAIVVPDNKVFNINGKMPALVRQAPVEYLCLFKTKPYFLCLDLALPD